MLILINILLVRTLGGLDYKHRGGGGVAHFNSLSENWNRLGAHVFLLSNAIDQTPNMANFFTKVYSMPSFQTRDQESGMWFMFASIMNYFRQKEELSRIAYSFDATQPTIVISESGYLSDVLAVRYITRAFKSVTTKGAVYFHHSQPSPFWFPLRRGGDIPLFV